jgi:hypothetical protein
MPPNQQPTVRTAGTNRITKPKEVSNQSYTQRTTTTTNQQCVRYT